MTKIQTILTEIESLKLDELELILSEIKKKIDRKKKVESILDDFIGKGKGIWGMDPQNFVENLREEERIIE